MAGFPPVVSFDTAPLEDIDDASTSLHDLLDYKFEHVLNFDSSPSILELGSPGLFLL